MSNLPDPDVISKQFKPNYILFIAMMSLVALLVTGVFYVSIYTSKFAKETMGISQ